jgi:hypothetical protein
MQHKTSTKAFRKIRQSLSPLHWKVAKFSSCHLYVRLSACQYMTIREYLNWNFMKSGVGQFYYTVWKTPIFFSSDDNNWCYTWTSIYVAARFSSVTRYTECIQNARTNFKHTSHQNKKKTSYKQMSRNELFFTLIERLHSANVSM